MSEPVLRWKMMDVAYANNLHCPRQLIVGVNTKFYPAFCYTGLGERGGGVGCYGIHSLRTLDEWLSWIAQFRDELTGRELRESIEAAKAPFVEPKCWGEFRKRYEETGDPFLP